MLESASSIGDFAGKSCKFAADFAISWYAHENFRILIFQVKPWREVYFITL